MVGNGEGLTVKTLSLFALLSCAVLAHADDLPNAPMPKPSTETPTGYISSGKRVAPHPIIRSKRLFGLDRSVVLFAVIQTGALTYDGFTTRDIEARCPRCREGNPVNRFFLGERPGWGRMTPLGAAEIIGAAYLTQWMRHSKHRPLRVASWFIQPFAAAHHLASGIGNATRCQPGCL